MDPLALAPYHAFCLAAVLYLVAAAAVGFRLREAWLWPLGLGLAANLASLALRLYLTWPLQAPFQEPYWVCAWLAVLVVALGLRGAQATARAVLPWLGGLGLWAALFPNDSYLPFARSHTIWAHLFLLLSSGGLACWWAAGGEALRFLAGGGREGGSRFGRLAAWGFVLYTLGLFAADVWSFLGWAAPVVWQDPAVVAGLGVWFYYALLLHLYLLRGWGVRRRAWLAAGGMLPLAVFHALPQSGPLCLPWWLA